MAVRAIAVIKEIQAETDFTFRVRMRIVAEGFSSGQEVLSDRYFSPEATADVVNDGVFDFVKNYISEHWGIVSVPGDTIRIIGPYVVSATSIFSAMPFRLGMYLLPWEWFKLKLR